MAAKKCPHQGGSIPYLLSVGARANEPKMLCFRFTRSLKAIKRRWARFGLPFPVVIINKMILALRREALASDNLALPFIFFSLPWRSLSKFSQFVKFVKPIFQKPKKGRGYKGGFLAIGNFVFSSSISNLVLWFFLSTGTRKGTNMLTIQQIWTSPRFISENV